MLESLKLDAEVLRLGILGGYVHTEEAIAWADAQIEASDVAPPWLVDISMAGLHPLDVATALSSVPGECPDGQVLPAVLSYMATVFDSRPEYRRRLASALYQLALDERVPSPTAAAEMLSFDDSYDLADSGIYGTRDDVDQRLSRFLSNWSITAGNPE